MTETASPIEIDGPNFDSARSEMVARQIRERGIRSPRVLQAISAVPRHQFVPAESLGEAYADGPLPIGEGQTISQPYIVAVMTEALRLEGSERVLEIGGGSGYQAAVLSLLAREVIAVESQPVLAARARNLLARLVYMNVCIEEGDGTLGWSSRAPYDAILVAAAAPYVPQALLNQLAQGGRMVIPVGEMDYQELICIEKANDGLVRRSLGGCRFVPLVGQCGWQRSSANSRDLARE
ncbi:MAG: protein-L-isoaspartate(D-aspartate) O-methyltransferase [Candidatus Acidiferrales bacterium]